MSLIRLKLHFKKINSDFLLVFILSHEKECSVGNVEFAQSLVGWLNTRVGKIGGGGGGGGFFKKNVKRGTPGYVNFFID